MEFTVLTFAKIQFLGQWKQVVSGSQFMTIYISLGKIETLLVLVESEAGGVYTYQFEILGQQQVLVSIQQNIVQIPAICVRSTVGDSTQCKG